MDARPGGTGGRQGGDSPHPRPQIQGTNRVRTHLGPNEARQWGGGVGGHGMVSGRRQRGILREHGPGNTHVLPAWQPGAAAGWAGLTRTSHGQELARGSDFLLRRRCRRCPSQCAPDPWHSTVARASLREGSHRRPLPRQPRRPRRRRPRGTTPSHGPSPRRPIPLHAAPRQRLEGRLEGQLAAVAAVVAAGAAVGQRGPRHSPTHLARRGAKLRHRPHRHSPIHLLHDPHRQLLPDPRPSPPVVRRRLMGRRRPQLWRRPGHQEQLHPRRTSAPRQPPPPRPTPSLAPQALSAGARRASPRPSSGEVCLDYGCGSGCGWGYG